MVEIALCLASRQVHSPGEAACVNSFIQHSTEKFVIEVNNEPARGAAKPVNDAIMKAYREHPEVDLFVVGADDVVCVTEGWDRLLEEAGKRYYYGNPCVFMADEGRKSGELLCHPVFSRKWIDILGYAVPRGYNHYYSDTDVERVARLAHCLHYVPEFKIDHRIGSADADWRPAKLALMKGDENHYRSQKARQEADAAKLRNHNDT